MDAELAEMQTFCQDIINFSMVHFGMMDRFRPHSRLYHRHIARAVVSLQVYLRDELRTCFLNSIGIVAEVLNYKTANFNIRSLLDWSFFSGGDIYNFILSNLATLIELILFLHTIDLAFPDNWFPRLWSYIYIYRMKDRLERNKGWDELIERSRVRYGGSHIYWEMCFVIGRRLEHPYGAVGLHRFDTVNLLQDFDPRRILLENLRKMKTTELCLHMMNCLYTEDSLMPEALYDNLEEEIFSADNIEYLLDGYPPPRSFERLV